jgi:hypothetical protein
MLAAAPHVDRVSGERFLLGAILGYETSSTEFLPIWTLVRGGGSPGMLARGRANGSAPVS